MLALDDGLVPVGAGGLPACASVRQQVPDSLPVFGVAGPASFGQFPVQLPTLPSGAAAGGQLRGGALGGVFVPQLGVRQQVAHALLGRPGLPVGVVGQAVTFGRPVIAVIGPVVAFSGPVIAALGGVIPGIAGLPPGLRAVVGAGSEPGRSLPVSAAVPRARRSLICARMRVPAFRASANRYASCSLSAISSAVALRVRNEYSASSAVRRVMSSCLSVITVSRVCRDLPVASASIPRLPVR